MARVLIAIASDEADANGVEAVPAPRTDNSGTTAKAAAELSVRLVEGYETPIEAAISRVWARIPLRICNRFWQAVHLGQANTEWGLRIPRESC